MIGMLEQMLMEMARRQDEQRARAHGGMLEGESVFAPRKGVGPRPFRDPMQAGPSPPSGQLSRMFGSPTVRGNIDVMHRPQAMNPNGDISTVRSMGVNVDGNEVLIPTVSEDARIMGDDEAIDQYRQTGRHLGMFDSPESSTAYAGRLHDQQEALGDARALSAGDMGPDARRARRRAGARPPMGQLSMMVRGQGE